MLDTDTGNSLITAYTGIQPYVFVSYAHADKTEVYAIIHWLSENGYRIWYDEGIELGENFPDEIAQRIRNCTYFVVFISNVSITRDFVIREIHYAKKCGRKMLPIYLEATTMPPGLDFTIGTIQGIEKYKLDEEQFHCFLEKGLHSECKDISEDSHDNKADHVTNASIRYEESVSFEKHSSSKKATLHWLIILQYIFTIIPVLAGYFLSFILYESPYHADELLLYIPLQSAIVLAINIVLYRIIKKRKLDTASAYKPHLLIILIGTVIGSLLDVFYILDFNKFNTSDAFHKFAYGGILEFPLLTTIVSIVLACIAPAILHFYFMLYQMKKQKGSDGSERYDIFSKKQTLLIQVLTGIFVAFTAVTALVNRDTYNTFGNTYEYLGDVYSSITSDNSYVYYYDEYGLYEIARDGSGKTLLTKDYCDDVLIDYGWLYYINRIDNNHIYKLFRQSNQISRLYDVSCADLSIEEDDDWIYYINASDDYKIYKVTKVGTDNTKLLDDSNIESLQVYDGWIYYCNGADNNSIYKMATDGSSKTKLFEGYSDDFEVSGEWIYFTKFIEDYRYKLYRMGTDGSGLTELDSDYVDSFHVEGDWIYYLTISGKNYFYKLRTDGEKKVLLNSY